MVSNGSSASLKTRRGIKAAEIPGLLDGRIFSGREALQVKLVDQIGGEDEAVKWLKDVKNVPADCQGRRLEARHRAGVTGLPA